MLSLHLICQAKFTENESNNNKKNSTGAVSPGSTSTPGFFFSIIESFNFTLCFLPKRRSINNIKQSKYLSAIPNSLKKKNLELQETATSMIHNRMKYVFLVRGVKEKVFFQ